MWIKYVKQHIEIFVVLLINILVFGIIFYAFELNFNVFIYGSIISIVLGLLYFFYKKSETKRNIENIKSYKRGITKLDIDNIEVQEVIKETDRIEDKLKEQLSLNNAESEELKRFITTWTHQIKTPISAINLQLEGQINKFELKNNLFSIEQYLNLLLNYFGHNSKSTDYVFQKVDVDKIIKEVLRKYAPLFIKKGLSIKYEPREFKIITDYKWLMFCLEQIISNSLKYTEKGYVEIVLEENSIIISDTGIGIGKEDIKRVTELGYTGYNGRIYSKSTGIGLYLTKEILEKLNLKIEINSNYGTQVKIIVND